ncbi:MAG: hypothetical protein ACH34Y_07040 [Brachymonas sp.]
MLLVASLLQAVYAEESSQSQEQCNDCDEYSADYKKVDDGRFFKKPYYSHPAQEAETEVKATPDPINLDSGFDRGCPEFCVNGAIVKTLASSPQTG